MTDHTEEIHLQQVANTIDWLAQELHHTACEKGFHRDEPRIRKILEKGGDVDTALRRWLRSTSEQASIGRIHSELSEWLEAVRSNPCSADDHLPEFEGRVVEAADAIIRILDECAKREYPIGQALIAKMTFNKGRPYRHGKNS